MLYQKFRFLEPFRQLLSNGLRNNSRAGKTNQRSRLGQDNISQHGKAGCHPACGGVCEHRNIEKPCLTVPFNGCGSLCHLHQGYHALLHSGTAGTAEQDNRQFFLCGPLKGAGDLLPHHVSHAPHEKTGVADTQHHPGAVNPGLTNADSLFQVCLFLLFCNLLLILRIVQGIKGMKPCTPFLERSLVRDHTDSGLGLDPEISLAFRTYIIIFYNVFLVEEFPAFGTFDP